MSELISILMPVYNCEQYLVNTLQSALLQTYDNFEIIIVNDGSTDHSAEIIYNFMSLTNKIKFINRNYNKGITYSLNEGLNYCDGEYICRLDSDDICAINRLEEQLKLIKTINADMVYSALYMNNMIVPTYSRSQFITIEDLFLYPGIVLPPSMMIKAKILKKYKFDYCFLEDYDLFVRLIQDGYKIFKSSDILLLYNKRKGSISDFLKATKKDYNSIMQTKINYLNKLNNKFEYNVIYSDEHIYSMFQSMVPYTWTCKKSELQNKINITDKTYPTLILDSDKIYTFPIQNLVHMKDYFII